MIDDFKNAIIRQLPVFLSDIKFFRVINIIQAYSKHIVNR